MDNLNKYYKSKNKFTTTINTAYENIDFKKLQPYDNSSDEILVLIHRSENIYSKKNHRKFCNFLELLNKKYPKKNFMDFTSIYKKQLISINCLVQFKFYINF